MDKYKCGLSANVLKIIALISMAIDHIGFVLLDDFLPFRIIGRIALPIFAYFIAEGCFYTKNKARYFYGIFILGLFCQLVYYCAEKDLHNNILITFSLSILLIYAYNYLVKVKNGAAWFILLLIALYGIIGWLSKSDITFDYGFYGIILPWIISLSHTKNQKLFLTALGIGLVSISIQGIQWYSLLSLAFLFLYNGKRGKNNIKYFFYAFYPLHIFIIYLINLLIDMRIYR